MKTRIITIAISLTTLTSMAQSFTTDTTDAETPIQTELIKEEIKTVNEHKDFFRLATGILGFLVPVAFWMGNDYGTKNRR
jgi:hypothetical protein